MRLLVALDEKPQRIACADYFAQCGCEVDVTGDPVLAESLARFRAYDVVLADTADAADRERLLELARRLNPAVLPVMLTTADELASDPAAITLTKPFALRAVLELATARL